MSQKEKAVQHVTKQKNYVRVKMCWHFSYLLFSRFVIFTFTNDFTLCKIVLCIWRKKIFFFYHNFMKKGHSTMSKNESENIP